MNGNPSHKKSVGFVMFQRAGIFFLLICASLSDVSAYSKTIIEEIQNQLRSRCEVMGTEAYSVKKERICASKALPSFYEQRAFQPVWVDSRGEMSPLVDELISSVEVSDQEGLRPEDYHLAEIKKILAEIRYKQQNRISSETGYLADLEILLTDAFLVYGAHLVKGRINPETIDPEWFANLREMDMSRVLEKAVQDRKVSETLMRLRPQQEGYKKLRDALSFYRGMPGKEAWPLVPQGKSLKPGHTGPRVSILRKRLILSGDLRPEPASLDAFFDDTLHVAVIHFQKRHGLDADGVAGPATLSMLNMSVSERIQQIELNLERWRWLPQDIGKRYIIVNIADYNLSVYENGEPVLDMRTVVGKTYRRTPVFSDRMTYIVMNPSWNIPNEIAVADLLPQVQKDPEYLTRMGIKVLQGWNANTKIIDPLTVNWQSLSPTIFFYRFKQDPGPQNFLGRIKFMFPNRFNVYIHDTPARELFKKASRSFSSGCIRIEDPVSLAEYLLSGHPEWTREGILAAIQTGIEQTVSVPQPIPVHILYWTAWVAADGTVQFRHDIYQRDKRLQAAMEIKAPGKQIN